MEFGPHTLGNRSILADPGNEEMQKRLNLNIKYRESFRPFAPSVLEEDAQVYSDLNHLSPLCFVGLVNPDYRLPLPENYKSLPYMEKLYCKRSLFFLLRM